MTASASPFGPLVRAHLRMSLRGRASQAFAGQLAGRPLGIVWLYGMYLAIGATTLPVLLRGTDDFTYALVTTLMTWTMCGLSLTAETGDALFNPVERDVVGHRPVDGEIVLGAKLVVLALFAASLALALNAVPALALVVRGRPGLAAAHALTVLLGVAVIATAVVAVFGLAAATVSRERFDDVAAWSQIALALLFVGLAIALPRATFASGVHVDPRARFLVALPPAWFAALELALVAPPVAPLGLAAEAVATLLVVVVVAWRAGMRPLADALALVEAEPGGRRVRPLPSGHGWLLGRWLRSPVELAAFRLATAYLRRDRDVRLRLRPSLVAFALLPLAGLVVEEQRGGHLVPLAAVSLLGMLPGVALEALRISSHPSAAELFAAAPLAGTSAVFHGARKAAMWYVLPGVAVATGLALAIVPGGLPLALPGLVAMPLFTLIPGFFGPYVPLALPKARGQQAIANSVLLATSTGALALLVSATLAASRRGRLLEFCIVELVVVVPAYALMRRLVARRGLTTREASPTYGVS